MKASRLLLTHQLALLPPCEVDCMSPRNQDGESCFHVFHGPQTLSPPQDGWDSILRKRPRGLVPSAPSFVFELVDFVGDRSLRKLN